MHRIVRYSKAHCFRFPVEIEKQLVRFCEDNALNKSDVVQAAVKCFFDNKTCKAKQRLSKAASA